MQAAMLVTALAMLSIVPFVQAQDASATPVFRVDSSLTLVDVIAEQSKGKLHTRELLTTLKREDFQVFDNDREVPIESFDTGAEFSTRPLAVWLIVECGDDQPVAKHSMFIHGKTQFLKPALTQLAAKDGVGVAHWCDNGQANLDLLPGHDVDAALSTIESILSAKPVKANDRPGELVMQRMIRMILKNARETEPRRLPVFLFLYGDGAATRAEEAYSIATDMLETSGIVYGLNDGKWIFDPRLMVHNLGDDVGPLQTFYLVHYYSRETGDDVYSVNDPKLFSDAISYLLTQLHLRYTLGFRPVKVDGKRHSLTVKLTPEAQKRFPGAELRFRPEYIPVANP